jgi:Gram-negative bacterial TonB protein C-terminal
MRFLTLSVFSLMTIHAVFSQTIMISPAKSNSPEYRPVLLGNGPNALINRIDVQDLVKKGQKDAAIMFTCTISKDGEIAWSGTYRGTPDSKLLEQELQKRLAPASDMKFIPAIYNGHPVDAIYYGTVIFAMVNGEPRLRIFSNQEATELERESDFIGPQPFFGEESKFDGLHYPSKSDAPVRLDGVAEIQINVDAKGNLQGIALAKEEPPFLGFGDAAVYDFSKAKFIPAFRDGKPVACQVRLPVYYKPKS